MPLRLVRLETTRSRARSLLAVAGLAATLLTTACRATPPQAPVAAHPEQTTPRQVSLGVVGRANDFLSLAADGTFVVAAWVAADAAGTMDVYTATSLDSGQTFAAPVRVNATPGDARANGEQPPRLALIRHQGGAAEIAVLWIARRTSGTVLLTARSTDGGQSYGASALMPGTDTIGNRGWQALAADPTGAVHAVWLDHRRMVAQAGGPPAHQHVHDASTPAPAAAEADDGTAMAQKSDLYFADLDGESTPRALTAGVCYCCKTAIAHGPDNAIYLAWRHVYPGNMRDIAFAMSRDGGRTFSPPVRVSEDGWSVAGCPDDGPAMTVDASGRVHVVWPTVVTTNGQSTKRLFHAMTTDGRTFSARVAIPHDGDAHHPQVAAAGDGSLAVAWDEFRGDLRVIARAIGKPDVSGAMTFRATPSASPVEGRYPVLASTGTGVVSAWVSGQGADAVVRVEPIVLQP